MIVENTNAAFENGIFKEDFIQFIKYKQGLGFSYGYGIQRHVPSVTGAAGRSSSRYSITLLNTVKATWA